MPKHDMEDIFRKKLEDFEAPHGDRWENIEAALPKEKKRKAAFWLWFGTGSVALIGAIALLLTYKAAPTNENIASQKNPTEKQQENPTATDLSTSKKENANQTELEETSSTSFENPTSSKNDLIHTPAKKRQYAQSTSLNWGEERATAIELPPSLEEQNVTIAPQNETPIQTLTPTDSILAAEASNVLPLPHLKEGDTIKVVKLPKQPVIIEANAEKLPSPVKWSMGIGFGAYSSNFNQKMPQNSGSSAIEQQGMVQRNRNLREKMEKPGLSFNQSLWVQYQPFRRWSFSTGISMVQTTQNLSFTVKSNIPDSIRGPQDFPESGNAGPSSQYLFANDSIFAGNTHTATNKYFAREIPLFVHYHFNLNPKFSMQLTGGVSYRWLTGASVFFADIDNVGMIQLNGPDYYPGLRSTWHLQGGIAFNYALNDYFNISAMPTFNCAMQSNIRFEHYVQQYQREWGLQVRLTRKLRPMD